MIGGRDGFTLEGLSATVARRLAELGLDNAVQDGRVSAVPDPRTIRYYATLGLLDRPTIAGRQARYGPRHALQLLAIKALQARGLPLGEVQSRLYGRSEEELEAIVAAAAAAVRGAPRAVRRPVLWREVVVEPGLKLVAEESWRASDASALVEKLRAALAAFEGVEGGGGGWGEDG